MYMGGKTASAFRVLCKDLLEWHVLRAPDVLALFVLPLALASLCKDLLGWATAAEQHPTSPADMQPFAYKSSKDVAKPLSELLLGGLPMRSLCLMPNLLPLQL
jgi:hypothetical protein